MDTKYMKLLVYIGIVSLFFYSGITLDSVYIWLILSIVSILLSLFDSAVIRTIITLIYSVFVYFYPDLIWGYSLIAFNFTLSLFLIPIFIFMTILGELPLVIIQILLTLVTHYYNKQFVFSNILDELYTNLDNSYQTQEIRDNKSREELLHNQEMELELSVLDERNRIARDIHDNVGHLLTSSILQLGALQSINDNPKLDPLYKTLKETLDEGMDSIRTSIHALYRDSYDLDRDIKHIISNFSHLTINYSNNIESIISTQIQSTIVYVVKEALTNTTKHSDSTDVVIKLTESEQHIYCIVQDFGSNILIESNNGIGLSSIEKRIRNINRIINIQTENGFRIYTSIPKEQL